MNRKEKEIEYYKKTDQVMKRFKNADKLYNQNPTFHAVVQLLVRDADIYEVMEMLIVNMDTNTKAMEQMAMRNTNPFTRGIQ